MKEQRNPTNVHPPLAAYSHQIELKGAERLLVLSGQVGMQPDGTIPLDAVSQLHVALENLQRNLDAAGMQREDLVKLTVFLAGQMDGDQRRAATAEWLGANRPCMTFVQVVALARPELHVEVDAWASRSD